MCAATADFFVPETLSKLRHRRSSIGHGAGRAAGACAGTDYRFRRNGRVGPHAFGPRKQTCRGTQTCFLLTCGPTLESTGSLRNNGRCRTGSCRQLPLSPARAGIREEIPAH